MNPVMLFHISEEAGIEQFEPRQSKYTSDAVVWAISADRLCNYLLPRECPRVTYYAGPNTSSSDVQRFLGSSSVVIAVESGWLEEIRSCQLFCYSLPPDTFESLDECAGYFVSRKAVVPTQVVIIDDVLGELLKRDVDLRLMPNLWTLRDDVVGSTLQFSMIRMRNAKEPTTA